MDDLQLTISYPIRSDNAGNLRLSDGRFATIEQQQLEARRKEQDKVIQEYRRGLAVSKTLRLMAEEIIELRKELNKQ